MSELLSAIDALRAEALPELADARIEADFAELQRAVELLEAERLRRLAEIDRRGLYARDGHLSTAGWLAATHRMTWGSARTWVQVARALEQMPRTRAALESGDVSLGAVRLLVEARAVHPEAFETAEATLVEAARIHPVGELRRVVACWQDRVEAEQEQGVDPRSARRRLHASVSFGGMVRVDGDLDPLTGESLLTALGAVLDAEVRARGAGGVPDERTPAQRRADGLGEICRQWLDRTDRPSVGGERPHLTVTVPVEVLAGGPVPGLGGGAGIQTGMGTGTGTGTGAGLGAGLGAGAGRSGSAELDHAGPVLPELARQFACDASVMRVVLGPGSEPLDVGRRTPVVSPAIRRAVILRDRHCRFPGCDRRPAWCDVHHVDHWAAGGRTAMGNLLLLCRRHHGLVHRRGFGLAIEGGAPVFRRQDGSVLADRGPP